MPGDESGVCSDCVREARLQLFVQHIDISGGGLRAGRLPPLAPDALVREETTEMLALLQSHGTARLCQGNLDAAPGKGFHDRNSRREAAEINRRPRPVEDDRSYPRLDTGASI